MIFIGTYQSFNVTNEDGRKVYSHDENFEPHFRGAVLPEGLAKIESGKGAGQVAFSFANLLKWHRPILILDEAHRRQRRFGCSTRSATASRAIPLALDVPMPGTRSSPSMNMAPTAGPTTCCSAAKWGMQRARPAAPAILMTQLETASAKPNPSARLR